MPFSKSIAFDDDEITSVATATGFSSDIGRAETEFIERLRQGDPDAFDVMVTRYSGDIYSLLCRMTEDVEEAADLTQETFLSSIKSISSFRGDSGLRTWLFRIAINHARNRFRWWNRRQRSHSVSLDATNSESESPLSERIASDELGPERETLRRERERAVVTELGNISVNYRDVIILCDIEGYSYEEIAETLGLNIGTVKSRLARGRDELRKRLIDL